MGGEDKAEGVDAGAQGPRMKYKGPSGAPATSKGLDKRVSWEGRYFIGLLEAEEPTYWDPRPGWAVRARPCVVHYHMQGPTPPQQWEYGCPLAVCTRDLLRKTRGTKGTHHVVRKPLKRSQERACTGSLVLRAEQRGWQVLQQDKWTGRVKGHG